MFPTSSNLKNRRSRGPKSRGPKSAKERFDSLNASYVYENNKFVREFMDKPYKQPEVKNRPACVEEMPFNAFTNSYKRSNVTIMPNTKKSKYQKQLEEANELCADYKNRGVNVLLNYEALANELRQLPYLRDVYNPNELLNRYYCLGQDEHSLVGLGFLSKSFKTPHKLGFLHKKTSPKKKQKMKSRYRKPMKYCTYGAYDGDPCLAHMRLQDRRKSRDRISKNNTARVPLLDGDALYSRILTCFDVVPKKSSLLDLYCRCCTKKKREKKEEQEKKDFGDGRKKIDINENRKKDKKKDGEKDDDETDKRSETDDKKDKDKKKKKKTDKIIEERVKIDKEKTKEKQIVEIPEEKTKEKIKEKREEKYEEKRKEKKHSDIMEDDKTSKDDLYKDTEKPKEEIPSIVETKREDEDGEKVDEKQTEEKEKVTKEEKQKHEKHKSKRKTKQEVKPPPVEPIKDCPCPLCEFMQHRKMAEPPCWMKQMIADRDKRDLLDYYKKLRQRDCDRHPTKRYVAPQHKVDQIYCRNDFCHDPTLTRVMDCCQGLKKLQEFLRNNENITGNGRNVDHIKQVRGNTIC